MSLYRWRYSPRVLAWLLAAALMRALLPAGVMPDRLGGLVLCAADGGAALLLPAAAGGGQGAGADAHHHSACPFAFAAVALLAAGLPPIPAARSETPKPLVALLLAGTRPLRPRARDPPRSPVVSA